MPADAAVPPAAAAQPALERSPARPRRRPTSFTRTQWIWLGLAALAAIFINVIGLWLAQAGRDAGAERLASSVTTYIYDNLPAFKSVIALISVAFGVFAVWSMRTAVVDNNNLSPERYRKLRQYHRVAGYSAAIAAFAVGLLTCVGIYGFGTDSPRQVMHSIFGTAALSLIVVKIAIVRYFPAWRRHLKLFGEAVFVVLVLVLLTSAVPWAWEHISGSGGGGNNSYYTILFP
jgi:hypothetical protein